MQTSIPTSSVGSFVIAPFDLFRTEDDGSVKWLGVCVDVDAAKSRVVELSVALAGEYFVFSQTTMLPAKVVASV